MAKKSNGFTDIARQLQEAKDYNEIAEIIEKWVVDEEVYFKVIDDIFGDKKSFSEEKLPLILEGFAASNESAKFSFFCMLVEAYYEELVFLGPAANCIHEEKYKHMINTITQVSQLSNNPLAYDLYLLVLRCDPKGEWFKEEEREVILYGLEEKLNYWVSECKKRALSTEENVMAAILFDVFTFINNSEIIKLLSEFSCFDSIDGNAKIFFSKCAVANNIDVDLSFFKEIRLDMSLLEPAVNSFNVINRIELLSDYGITQEMVAESNLYRWLMYPTELGKAPNTLEYVTSFDEDELRYYIFKFTSDIDIERVKDRGEMIGISGGYFIQEDITSVNSGMTFSDFNNIQKDCIQQAKGLIQKIKDFWKNYQSN